MRSMKQTEWQLLLMESSLAYPRGKEEKRRNSKKRQNSKGEQTLGYLGVVKPVTPKEDVPLRGTKIDGIIYSLRSNPRALQTLFILFQKDFYCLYRCLFLVSP
ncbi:hypothetical protein AVEN_1585-1 [Araneus ventricosus]|uniref:Uncharacterized protein n=1 Tax=Araneus ventricosus TaxID=182803 RepID=A0A4Y2DTP3_ARAVE|nr:hypothetical protein AVEN_1585-1 [Araneus ventricosus]